ncbi:MAG: helix-turn-helix transcriptional regulator [Isosphaeraceae bacterium]
MTIASQVESPTARLRRLETEHFRRLNENDKRARQGLPPLPLELEPDPILPSIEPPAEVPGQEPIAGAVEMSAGLSATLVKLADAVAKLAEIQAAERLALRAEEAADSVGMSRRAWDRGVAAGEIPPADRHVGRIGFWSRETIMAWLRGKVVAK